MNFNTVIAAVKLAGAATPAFKALFEQVLTTFKPMQQEALKTAYAEAREASDDAQDDFVQAGRGN